MTHYCPICEKDISDLVSWKNLIAQLDHNIMLFCPQCNVGLILEYDEKYNSDTNEVHELWSFRIATRGD